MNDIVQQIPRHIGEVKPYKTPDKPWEEVSDEIYGSHDLPENIYFIHDEKWARRVWAIQNIGEQGRFERFGFWSLVALVFLMADLSWTFGAIFMRFRY